MMFYTIYKITNKVNNKIYIGKHITTNIDDDYMGSGKLLIRAIKKYGIENFKKDILYVFQTEIEMNKKEAEVVSEDFCMRDDTYNLCSGGKGGWTYINRNKLNLYGKNGKSGYGKENLLIGNIRNRMLETGKYNQWCKNISDGLISAYSEGLENGFKGKKHSISTIQKWKEKRKGTGKGSTNSQYGTCWMMNDKHEIKIRLSDIQNYIDLGYTKGRRIPKRTM